MIYSKTFADAAAFTRSQRLKIDSDSPAVVSEQKVANAVREIASGLFEQIQCHRKLGRDPYMALGGDCANVHFLIAQFLLQNYPDLSPNLAMGSVVLNQQEPFNFSQEQFIAWRQTGYGDVFSCHAWVSLGQDWIIDATIGSWIHTRLGAGNAFGGVLYGSPSSLNNMPIANEKNVKPLLTCIRYEPIVLGLEAFTLVHQARERSRRNGA